MSTHPAPKPSPLVSFHPAWLIVLPLAVALGIVLLIPKGPAPKPQPVPKKLTCGEVVQAFRVFYFDDNGKAPDAEMLDLVRRNAPECPEYATDDTDGDS